MSLQEEWVFLFILFILSIDGGGPSPITLLWHLIPHNIIILTLTVVSKVMPGIKNLCKTQSKYYIEWIRQYSQIYAHFYYYYYYYYYYYFLFIIGPVKQRS